MTQAAVYTLGELAERLGAELRGGSTETTVRGVAGLEAAAPDQLSFVANPRYTVLARGTRAAAVLVEPGFAEIPVATLRLPEPYLAFAQAVELFYQPPTYPPGIHPLASIDPTARIGRGAHIGAFAVIMEGATIGDFATVLPHAVIYPHVRAGDRLMMHSHSVLREHCQVGDDVVLQNGAVVGADGFGFAPEPGHGWHKIPQSGPAVLGDRVEVQANACVDRASVGETRIGAGTKIDNLVQVGHGSTVGEDTLLCAQVGLAGSTRVGNRVILAGQVGVAGHCTVGDGAVATAQSGIPSDVAPGAVVSGYPAVENRKWLRSVALLNQLPGILRTLREHTGNKP